MHDPSGVSRYNRGYRPRCKVCDRELEPCPIYDHDYPQRVRYSRLQPCPDHPQRGLPADTFIASLRKEEEGDCLGREVCHAVLAVKGRAKARSRPPKPGRVP